MQVLADDAIWKIAETAKEAVQGKSEWIEHSARIAAEVAVDVVTNFATEDLTEEERVHLMRYAIAIAAERLSDLVGYLAQDLADEYF